MVPCTASHVWLVIHPSKPEAVTVWCFMHLATLIHARVGGVW